MLDKLKRWGGEVSNDTIKYRYNDKLAVFERADVGCDNWTQFYIL